MDITSPSPLGAHAQLAAMQTLRRVPDSTRVEPAPDAGGARADMRNGQPQHRDPEPLGPARSFLLDPDQPVGPPPSFQVNVLELARHLQQNLAKLEAERAHAAETQFAAKANPALDLIAEPVHAPEQEPAAKREVEEADATQSQDETPVAKPDQRALAPADMGD